MDKVRSIKIGVLEDDHPQAELLQSWLLDEGYTTYWSDTGAGLIERLEQEKPDALILDWCLPDCEGIEVLKELRTNKGFNGPVLFATAKDSEEDIVRGLSAGADDYLVKPLRRSELLARLAALWRRIAPRQSNRYHIGPIEVQPDQQRILVAGDVVQLTGTEYRLAACLLENEDKLLSRDFLLKEVWGVGADIDTRTVDVHIGKIRRILRIGPEIGYCIRTVYRHGYRLERLEPWKEGDR